MRAKLNLKEQFFTKIDTNELKQKMGEEDLNDNRKRRNHAKTDDFTSYAVKTFETKTGP